MVPSFSYNSFVDYTVLPKRRKVCAAGATELEVTNWPAAHLDAVVEEARRGEHARNEIFKDDIYSSNPPLSTSILAFMTACHALAADVFKNLFHDMELPWEKYLGEMHEFGAKGRDVLRIMNPESTKGDPIAMNWSTLTLDFTEASPNTCRVVFGEAMSVFSQDAVKSTTKNTIDLDSNRNQTNRDLYNGTTSSTIFAYDMRPNDEVYYTRTAGALMDPLTQAEYDGRRRVGEMVDVRAWRSWRTWIKRISCR